MCMHGLLLPLIQDNHYVVYHYCNAILFNLHIVNLLVTLTIFISVE